MNRTEAEHYINMHPLGQRVAATYDRDRDLRVAIATLMPDFEYPDWSHRPLADFLKHVNKPRRLTVPAHCLDEDCLRAISNLGVKIVNLKDAPWGVTFEGTAAALHEMYETHWDDGPCPEFDKEAT